jgi:hypothetical protein
VGNGSTLTLNGATITDGTINDYTSVPSGAIIPGDIDITGSSTINGGASLNNGNVTIESGQALTLDDVTVTGTTVTFAGSGDMLKLSQPSSFNGTIAGLAATDKIDLIGITYAPNEYALWTQTTITGIGAGTL